MDPSDIYIYSRTHVEQDTLARTDFLSNVSIMRWFLLKYEHTPQTKATNIESLMAIFCLQDGFGGPRLVATLKTGRFFLPFIIWLNDHVANRGTTLKRCALRRGTSVDLSRIEIPLDLLH